MRGPIAAVAALVGGLLFLPATQEPASAISTPINLDSQGSTSPSVMLVGHGGGGGGPVGGGGGGGGPGGGGGAHAGGGGGGSAVVGGGGRVGGGNYVSRGAGRDYGGRAYGRDYVGRAYGGPRYATRDFNRGIPRGDRGQYAEHKFNNRRYAERDHNGHDHDHFRHRVLRNGVWVWVYGPDYYAYGDDCWWLRQQAYATGSRYWWSRYDACVGYY